MIPVEEPGEEPRAAQAGVRVPHAALAQDETQGEVRDAIPFAVLAQGAIQGEAPDAIPFAVRV